MSTNDTPTLRDAAEAWYEAQGWDDRLLQGTGPATHDLVMAIRTERARPTDDAQSLVDLRFCIGAECNRLHGTRVATWRGTGPASIYIVCDECHAARLTDEERAHMVEVRGAEWIRHLGLHWLHGGRLPREWAAGDGEKRGMSTNDTHDRTTADSAELAGLLPSLPAALAYIKDGAVQSWSSDAMLRAIQRLARACELLLAERAVVTARPLAALRAAGVEVAEQPMATDTRVRFDHPVTGEPLYRQAMPEEIERLRAGGAADVALWQEHIDGIHGDATCALSVLAVGSPTQEQRQIAIRTTQTAIDALATAASQGMKAWLVTGTPEKVRSGNGDE